MKPILIAEPIGIIRTKYVRKSDAPRQPGMAEETIRGRIILRPGKNFEQALKDIDGFERIWVVSWFDRNQNWKPLVLPPGSRTKRGVFATRAPHRPNPIGISLCRLISVKGRTLVVENPDLLDRTPILDLKPYIPIIDAVTESRSGWAGEREKKALTLFTVKIESGARDQINWLRETQGIDLESSLRSTLTVDPFPHPYRRIKAGPGNTFTLSIRSWRVVFRIDRQTVLVEQVLSGYTRSEVRSGQPHLLHDGPAHVAFHTQWPKQFR